MGRGIDKSTPGTSDGFLLDTYPGNSLRLITEAGVLNSRNSLPVATWSHVAAVIDPVKRKIAIYLNGKVIAEKEVEVEEGLDDAEKVTRGYILQRWMNACGGRGNFPD